MADQLPNIPKTYHRHDMTPQKRVESYTDMAAALMETVREANTEDEVLTAVCLSLAAAYAEGHQDGRIYGEYEPGENNVH
jgi:hypothetical protein